MFPRFSCFYYIIFDGAGTGNPVPFPFRTLRSGRGDPVALALTRAEGCRPGWLKPPGSFGRSL
jgi:hypothetical protein